MRVSGLPFPISPLPLVTLGFLLAGLVTPLAVAADPWRDRVWLLGLVVTGVPVAWRTFRGVVRGEFAADVVAMLAIVGAWGARSRACKQLRKRLYRHMWLRDGFSTDHRMPAEWAARHSEAVKA